MRMRRAGLWNNHDFMQLPRSGDTVYGFVAGLYPTEYPALPERGDAVG